MNAPEPETREHPPEEEGSLKGFLKLLTPYAQHGGEAPRTEGRSWQVSDALATPSPPDSAPPPLPGDAATSPPPPPPMFPIPLGPSESMEADPMEQTCVLVGPTGAGKTSLLASLDAACFDEGARGERLAIFWNRQSDAADLLQRAARQWIGFGDSPSSTATSTAYSVELTSSRRPSLLRRSAMKVTQLRFVEEPGQHLFPASSDAKEHEAPTLTLRQQVELAGATTLVLVVDASRQCGATVEATLPSLLDRLASSRPGERLGRRPGGGILSRVGLFSGRAAPRRNRLGVKRLLLLLNKVDVIANAEASAQRAAGEAVSALAVARALDPIGLALEVVGARCLRRLRRSVGADADFAIGVVSASGFYRESGEAFSASNVRSPDERLQAWAPFGVGDALRFVALGRCGPTIQPITEAELAVDQIHSIKRHTFQGAE